MRKQSLRAHSQFCPCGSLRWRWGSGQSHWEELELSASFMGRSGGVAMGEPALLDRRAQRCRQSERPCSLGSGLWHRLLPLLSSFFPSPWELSLIPPWLQAGVGSSLPSLPFSCSPHSLCLILWPHPEALRDRCWPLPVVSAALSTGPGSLYSVSVCWMGIE